LAALPKSVFIVGNRDKSNAAGDRRIPLCSDEKGESSDRF